jgi:hypothetical protein
MDDGRIVRTLKRIKEDETPTSWLVPGLCCTFIDLLYSFAHHPE